MFLRLLNTRHKMTRFFVQLVAVFSLLTFVVSATHATTVADENEAVAPTFDPVVVQSIETVIKGWAASAAKPGEIFERNAKDVLKFYKSRDYAPLWFETKTWSEKSNQLLTVIENSASEGLNPDHYLPEKLRDGFQEDTDLQPVMIAVLDILQTAALMHYAIDVSEGRYADVREIKSRELLATGLATEDFGDWLGSLPPSKAAYQQLKSYLPIYQSLAKAGDWPQFTIDKSIRPKSKSKKIAIIREQLYRLGDWDAETSVATRLPHGIQLSNDATINDPNYYDQELVRAVMIFQARHGLAVDGIIGRQTAIHLNMAPKFRLKQIRANLERLRWQKNEDAERYVHVNIAAFWLKAYENGQQVLEMPVVVGRDERPTPVLNDKIINLKFSPDWTIPPTIIEKDYIPKLQENPFYFEELGWPVKHYGESTPGYLIDWYSVAPKSLSVVQPPGPRAPLGGVRFSLTNDQFIYLHDTPGKGVFKKNFRAVSSGCVRVGDAPALAQYLLKQEGWSKEKISSAMTSGDTRYKPLREPVAVSLSYLTAWIDDSGMLQFRSDVYLLDEALIDRMG